MENNNHFMSMLMMNSNNNGGNGAGNASNGSMGQSRDTGQANIPFNQDLMNMMNALENNDNNNGNGNVNVNNNNSGGNNSANVTASGVFNNAGMTNNYNNINNNNLGGMNNNYNNNSMSMPPSGATTPVPDNSMAMMMMAMGAQQQEQGAGNTGMSNQFSFSGAGSNSISSSNSMPSYQNNMNILGSNNMSNQNNNNDNMSMFLQQHLGGQGGSNSNNDNSNTATNNNNIMNINTMNVGTGLNLNSNMNTMSNVNGVNMNNNLNTNNGNGLNMNSNMNMNNGNGFNMNSNNSSGSTNSIINNNNSNSNSNIMMAQFAGFSNNNDANGNVLPLLNNSGNNNWMGNTVSVPVKTGEPVNYLSCRQIQQASTIMNNTIGGGGGGNTPQQFQQASSNDNISSGGGGNATEMNRSSSEPMLNAMFGNDGESFFLGGGQSKSNNAFDSQLANILEQHGGSVAEKNALLNILCSGMNNNGMGNGGMNNSGMNTDQLAGVSYASSGDNNNNSHSQQRRKSEPAISILDDIFGMDTFMGSGNNKDCNHGNERGSTDGWLSSTSHSPEPNFDDFASSLKQIGNTTTTKRSQRSNSEPLLTDMLMEAFDDFDPENVFDEIKRGSLITKPQRRPQDEKKRSRSFDMMESFVNDPIFLGDGTSEAVNASNININTNSASHPVFPPPATSFDSNQGRKNKNTETFASLFTEDLFGSNNQNRNTKEDKSVPSRRQGGHGGQVKRSRSMDPVEMFSSLGNELYEDTPEDDDNNDPFAFDSDLHDDKFKGLSPEEQQRLERLGIFSRNKPKRRRSAPLLHQDFFGDLSDLADDGKNGDNNQVSGTFGEFPEISFRPNVSSAASQQNASQQIINNSAAHGTSDSLQSNNNLQLIQMLFGMEESKGNTNIASTNAQIVSKNNTFINTMNNVGASANNYPEPPVQTGLYMSPSPQSPNSITASPKPSILKKSNASQVIVQRLPTKMHQIKSHPPPQQAQSSNDYYVNNLTAKGEGFKHNQANAGFNAQINVSTSSASSDDDLFNVLQAVRNFQNELKNLHPLVIQSRNPAAMEDIAKAFEITAKSSNFLLSSDLANARSSLNEAEAKIKKLHELLHISRNIGCTDQNSGISGAMAEAPLAVQSSGSIKNASSKATAAFPQDRKQPGAAKTKKTLKGSVVSAPLPLPSVSKAKKANKASAKIKVVELEELPPQNGEDPSVIMSRLKSLMERTQVSQKQLQKWDKKNGLPKSHSQTMVNSNRSRKQLQKGVILKKWNGAPLIKVDKKGNEKESVPTNNAESEQQTTNIETGTSNNELAESEDKVESFDSSIKKVDSDAFIDGATLDTELKREADISTVKRDVELSKITLDDDSIEMDFGELSELEEHAIEENAIV